VATAVLLASALLVTIIDPAPLTSPSVERPNIIFVLTDDQFPGTENETPALKNNITSKGVEFTNTISTFPLCCPARATILRGQYPHNTHIYGNELPLGGGKSSMALACRTAPSPLGCTTPGTGPACSAST
jgi:N-acetylglucosamine-6-sulfatase